MRFTTYSKYKGKWLDALNLESLLEHLSDFLMDGGFAGGAHHHPYWGWSGDEDVNSADSLKDALLKALIESGQLTSEMIEELRGEGQGDDAIREKIAELLDDLIARMADEGFIDLESGNPQIPGATYDVTGQGKIDDAKQAAQQVNFSLTQKGMDFLGYRALKGLLGALGKSSAGSHDTPHL
jgi:Ca-activated chloride channel family protein